MMNEDQVKKIASDVFDEKLQATQFGFNSIPYHTHNGTDSPTISRAAVNASFTANGSITMATDGQTYTLGLNFRGTRVDFNGTAVHRTAGTIDKRALVNGCGFLGASYVLSLGTANSVTVGGPVQPFIQGCSSMTIDAAATPPYAVFTSQDHIVYVVQPGTGAAVATALITSFGANNVKVKVALTSGWEITGVFAVS